MVNARRADVVVIGAGPGGYVAALRAADLGREVVMVEARSSRGGVCLLEGCIPSKALISAVELAEAARDAQRMGISFDGLRVDPRQLRAFTDSVVGGLTRGIDALLNKRGVEIIRGWARFEGSNRLRIDGAGADVLEFNHCVIASGSRPMDLPPAGDLPLWTSTQALQLEHIPKRLMVIGGGYIGLELGLVYAGLGSRVTCVEMQSSLLAGADADLVAYVARSCKKRFDAVLLDSKVVRVERSAAGYVASIEQRGQTTPHEFDEILVAIGRRPNTDDLGLENTGITTDRAGLIPVDAQRRTTQGHIYAIGDVTAGPGLAHKASREGKVAAEVIAGRPSAFDNVSVPAIVFTDPEVAWVGLTEQQASAQGREVQIGRFPLAALGRARTIGRSDGMAKVIADKQNNLVLGVGVAGPHASELIAEASLALELGATVEDVAATIHPHPTLSESMAEAAEAAESACVHIFPPSGR